MARRNVSWGNLPSELVENIGQKMVGSCEDFIRFSAVSKSWQSVAFKMMQDGSTFLLSPESPLLLLAEDVPEGYSLRCCDINVHEDGLEEVSDDEDLEEDEDEEGLQEEEDEEEDFADEEGDDDDDEEMADLEEKEFIFSVGTARGIYSLSTEKIYTLELPEAAGKSIRGTNKGWLLTLGISLCYQLVVLVDYTYTIDLPEAAGKWILRTSKGWVLSLGGRFRNQSPASFIKTPDSASLNVQL